jgi:hypothetical protein
MSDILNNTPRPNGHDRAASRAAINRGNSTHSTGPRTDAGKQRCKLNALRHGLTGQTVVLPTEDHSAYQRHAQSLLHECQPKGAIETQLVQSLIDNSWRLNRVAAVETNLLALGIAENENRVHAAHPEVDSALAMALSFRDNVHAFSNISIYCQRIARLFERTLAQLRQVQAERGAKEQHDLDQAADLLELHQERQAQRAATGGRHPAEEFLATASAAPFCAGPWDQVPYNPIHDGFVFSSDQIETFIQRRERLSQARSASLERFEAGA